MELRDLDTDSLYQYKDHDFDILCTYSGKMELHGRYVFKVISSVNNRWGESDLHLYATHIKERLTKLS